MTRVITIISGKGGVGKTTTVTNLGMALLKQGKDVLILDANVTTPNLSLHLGIPHYPVTLHDVLNKKVPADLAVYNHPSGLKIVPASLAMHEVKNPRLEKLEPALLHLLGQADIILVDAAAGLGKEAQAAMKIADELIIVTNPELPAVTDALKTIRLAQDFGIHVSGVVLNRVRGYKHELDLDEVQMMLEVPIVATIPEDIAVPRSIASKTPVVNHRPRSRSSNAFRQLASRISGGHPIQERAEPWYNRLFSWMN